jgi:hypothetical protein
MNIFLIIIYCSILFSETNATKPNLCINCKHFKNDILVANRFGKCALFPNIIKDDDDYYSVNGIQKVTNIDYKFCFIARKYDFYCGKEGKLYEKKPNIWDVLHP